MLFFGVYFFLYFIKLSAGNGFWASLNISRIIKYDFYRLDAT